MKKLLSVLLALAMLLCAVPMAFAEEAEPDLWFSIESRLLQMNYGDADTRTEIAVGDELWVIYNCDAPADVYVNGEKTYTLPNAEDNTYAYTVSKTGELTFSVRRGGETLLDRSFTVISSREMYPKTVKAAFAAMASLQVNPFPSVEELKEAGNNGFPVGNPFIPFAFFAMVLTNLLHAVFSFTRIVG